jgi:hypothetical protein
MKTTQIILKITHTLTPAASTGAASVLWAEGWR